jgi:hypothetical protein
MMIKRFQKKQPAQNLVRAEIIPAKKQCKNEYLIANQIHAIF